MTMTELPARPDLTSLADPVLVATPDAFVAWRKALGWTQDEAARQIGLTRKSIQRYEWGEAPIPRYVQLACWALRRAPHHLFLE